MRHDALSNAAEQIGFASTKEPDRAKPRWTELLIFYDPRPRERGRPFIVMSRGCSSIRGETVREEVHAFGTLERACGWFDEGTQLGRTVVMQALDWADTHVVAPPASPDAGAVSRARESGGAFRGETQKEALAWLYPDEPRGRATREAQFARDFGLGETTVQAALRRDGEIRVPLLRVLPFFDVAAFRAAREAADG